MNMLHPELIGLHSPGWLEDIETQVEADFVQWPDARAFALVDCAFSDRCFSLMRKRSLDFRTLFDLSDSPSEALQAVSPTLLPLTRETTLAWKEILSPTDGFPMLSMIVTPESLDELALRLDPWCIVDADGQAFVFRFPDTRRLPGIVEVLSPEQHGMLFGPAYAWRFRTRSAQWADLPLPTAPCPAAERVRLDALQCAYLIRDSEADEIMADLNLNEPALMRQYHPADAHALVATGLQRADRYGIPSADRTQWCRFLLQQPRLEQLPAAMPLLASLVSKERSYADIADELATLSHS